MNNFQNSSGAGAILLLSNIKVSESITDIEELRYNVQTNCAEELGGCDQTAYFKKECLFLTHVLVNIFKYQDLIIMNMANMLAILGSDGAVTKIVSYGFSWLSSSWVQVESVMDFKKKCRLRFFAVIKKPGQLPK